MTRPNPSRWLRFAVLSAVILMAAPIAPSQEKKLAPPNSSGKVEPQAKSRTAPPAPQTPKAVQKKIELDKPRQREQWFYEGRVTPQGFIPGGIRQKAIERLEQMRQAERARQANAAPGDFSHIPLSGTVWTPIGPQPTATSATGFGNTSGRVSAVAVHPTDANIVYIGGAQGGVWKTTDGGVNWIPLTDQEASLAIGAIAIDPVNPNIVYVGTGEQTFSIGSYYGAGILKSTDAGASWTNIPGPFAGPLSVSTGGARISSIAIQPGNSNVLIAGVQIFTSVAGGASSGVYRSLDAGQTWTQVVSGAAGTEVLFDPANGMIAYAGLGTISGDPENGVYKSTDGGATFSKLTLPAPATAANVGRIELAIGGVGNSNVLYASVADAGTNSSHMLMMFKTTNSGANWTALGTQNVAPLSGTSSYCSAQCWYDHVIKVHPNDPNVVYAGGAANFYLMRSTNGGTAWSPIINSGLGFLHVDQQAMGIGFSGAQAVRLYVGNDGGMWSVDISNPTAAINWTNLNSTLNITQFYPGHSIHPSDIDTGFGGTQDNSTQKYSGSLLWQNVTCGDGGWTAIDYTAPTNVYATCQQVAIRRSVSGGNVGTFTSINGNIATSDPGAFIPPFIIDPNIPTRLYFGSNRVWQSADATATPVNWVAISPDVSGGGTLRSIAVAPTDSNIVYTGSSTGTIQRTLTAGAGGLQPWTNLTTADLPARLVTQIAVAATDASGNTAYATFSGFSRPPGGDPTLFPDTKGHVFKTTNGGANWTDISIAPFSATPLPNTPVNDIIIDPDVPSTLYVGTDVGVFVSTDDGINWQTMVTGLPRVAVLGLKLHRPSRTLRAGTHGRGMWDVQLVNFNPAFVLSSISPVQAPIGSPDVTLTVNGNGFVNGTTIVRFNGTNLVTTCASANQCTATIPAALMTSGVFAQITVFEPSQAPSSTSNALIFSVSNPTPTLNSISPTQHLADGQPFTLTLNGVNFLGTVGGAPVTEVRWNGSPRTTNATLVTATQITVQIPGSDVTAAGTANVTVFNASPGGGSSNGLTFSIGSPPPNDNFANATVISSSPFTDTVNNAVATVEAGDPFPNSACVGGFPSGGRNRTIWYRFVATATVTGVMVDTTGSTYDSVLSLWTGAPGSFTEVACDDDGLGTIGGGSRLPPLQLNAGTTYHFMVGGFSSTSTGNSVFNFTIPLTFSLSANPGTITVTRGQSGTSTLTVTPVNGPFTSAVTFSCLGLPSQSTCSFNPTSVTPGANPVTTTLTITTTAPSALPPLAPMRWPAPPLPLLWLVILAALLLVAGLSAGKWQVAARRRWQMGFYGVAIFILGSLAVACGGGGGGGGGGGTTSNPGTPRGTVTVIVRGTSGTTTATTNVTLTVN